MSCGPQWLIDTEASIKGRCLLHTVYISYSWVLYLTFPSSSLLFICPGWLQRWQQWRRRAATTTCVISGLWASLPSSWLSFNHPCLTSTQWGESARYSTDSWKHRRNELCMVSKQRDKHYRLVLCNILAAWFAFYLLAAMACKQLRHFPSRDI